MDRRLDNRSRYNALAGVYEGLVRRASFGQFDRFYRAVADEIDACPGGTIADLGCGPATLTPYLLPKVGPEGRVVGVDIADRMVTRAQEIAVERGWHNARFECRAAIEFSHPSPVDAVVFCLSLTTMPECEACLANAVSALKPGGQLVILDSIPEPTRRFASVIIRLKAPLVGARPSARPLEFVREQLDDVRIRRFHLGVYSLIAARASSRTPGAVGPDPVLS